MSSLLSASDKYLILVQELQRHKHGSAEWHWVERGLQATRVPVKPYVLLYQHLPLDLCFVGDEAGNVHPVSGQIFRTFPNMLSPELRVMDTKPNHPWLTIEFPGLHPVLPLSQVSDDKQLMVKIRQVDLRLWGYDTESHRFHMYAVLDQETKTWLIGGMSTYEKAWWEKWGAVRVRSLTRSSFVPLLRSRKNATPAILNWTDLRRIYGLSSL